MAYVDFGLLRQIASQICDHLRLSHRVLVINQSIKPRPNYQPESFSSTAYNGRGLIQPISRVIICLSHIPVHCFKALTYTNVSKTEDWCRFCVTSCHFFISDVK